MFHPPDSADTHGDIFIQTTKLLLDDCCRVSLFHKKFNDSTLTKRHVCTLPYLHIHGLVFENGLHHLKMRLTLKLREL
jgi:hypothetical protein